MVNICELLINVVIANKPKMLCVEYTRLEPKGMWLSTGVLRLPVAVVVPPAERQDLTHAGIQAKRGKPVCFPTKGRQPQGELMSMRVEEDGKSKGRFVMKRIGVAADVNITPRASELTSIRSFITREFVKPS